MLNAITLYRVAHTLVRWRVPLLPALIRLVIFLMYNSVVPPECEIGEGSFLAYGGVGVVIHRKSKIGNNVNIGSNVVIGGKSGGKEVPRIGNNVFLSTGSKILGDIEIGDFVVVGANAVVTRSVPSFSIVAGIPAKVIRANITEEKYHSMT